MPIDTHATDQLVALIETARAEALRVGPGASEIAALLEQAAQAARSAAVGGGRPDEGLRPDELTTGNDK